MRRALRAARRLRAWIPLALLAGCGAARADTTPYFEVGGGFDVPADAPVTTASGSQTLGTVLISSGFAVGLAAGLDFGWLRGALRTDLRRGDVDGTSGSAAGIAALPRPGEIGVLTLMPALALDLPVPLGHTQLHADAGLGAAQLRDTSFGDWAFAWSVGGGSYRPLIGPVGLDLVYRYTSTSEGFEVPGSGARLEWSDHAVTLSLRLAFPVSDG